MNEVLMEKLTQSQSKALKLFEDLISRMDDEACTAFIHRAEGMRAMLDIMQNVSSVDCEVQDVHLHLAKQMDRVQGRTTEDSHTAEALILDVMVKEDEQ